MNRTQVLRPPVARVPGAMWLFIALAFAAAIPAIARAETPEEKGLAIEQERDRRDTGWGDSSVTLKMILRNRHDQESTRQLRNRSLENTDDGDWALIVFDEPRDVEGTALLTYTHKQGADDQWLYLPALKRVKRIASNNKSGPFMGSEFAYEDLSSQETEKYTYRWLRDESLDGVDCFVIERDPVDANSGYSKQVVWMDKAEYRPLKIEYHDRKNTLLKTLTFSDYAQYLDKYWRASRMEMVNHQTGKSTVLQFSDYRFGNGYTAADFTQNSLKKAR